MEHQYQSGPVLRFEKRGRFLLLAYLGPLVRKLAPEGITLADYVRQRMGRTMQIYVGVISIIYMFAPMVMMMVS